METSEKFKLVAKTFQGLEEVLYNELVELGAGNVEIQNRAVTFTGDNALMYKANYYLRTALNVLKPIAEFRAKDEDEFYKEIGRINWNDYMEVDETFSISSVTFSKTFNHSKYVSLKAKDAIVDQFRRRLGKRPDVNTIEPDLRIHIHIAENFCTVLLDSSGEPLFKRGYRTKTNKAPINEVLAAGMIKLTGWNYDTDFIDPMCGSGTLLIEAAMQAYGIPAGTYRQHFGFENWKDFDSDLFEQILDEAPDERTFEHNIIGSDISPLVVKMAEENIKNASLAKKITVKPQNFFDTKPKNAGILVSNPPYGERLQPDDLQIFYQKIGDKLKIDYTDFDAWIIGSNTDVMKFIGLRPNKKIKLYNGPLECSFRKFALYDGSIKDQYTDESN